MLNFSPIDTFIKKYSEKSYSYTTTVRHKGIVIAFAMDNEQHIYYTTLDLDSKNRQPSQDVTNVRGVANVGSNDDKLDVNCWENLQELRFPNEIAEVGYGVADQTLLSVFKKGSKTAEKLGTALPAENSDSKNAFDYFLSTTARLTADAPFQAFSDEQYIYVFRQAIADSSQHMVFNLKDGHLAYFDDDGKLPSIDSDVKAIDKGVPIVNSTLLLDRFVLVGNQLQNKMEVRYQRSRSKTRPESRKDSLGAKDMDGNPFLEPTQELKFVKNLVDGRFTVLLLPTQVVEIERWQIFSYNSKTHLIDSYSVERSQDGLFNTRGSQFYTSPDEKHKKDVFESKPGKDPFTGKDLIPIVSKSGEAESALKFNGGNDRVDLGGGVTLGSEFTLEAWICPTDSNDTNLQSLITTDYSAADSNYRPNAGPSLWIKDKTRLLFGFGDSQHWNELTTSDLLTTGKWNHIAITFDGTEVRVYINAQLYEKKDCVDTNNILQQTTKSADGLQPLKERHPVNTPVKLFGATSNSFRGTIDEIRLWKRIRSQQELQTDLNQRLSGQEFGLAGYWRFDEAKGNIVYDQTDNKINGTLNGGTWVTSDAPVGESMGVVRDSFQMVSPKPQNQSEIEIRSIESGLTSLLYYQQVPISSGYDGKQKPLKQNARVMLAMSTKAPDDNKCEIAVLDFGVSQSGKLAKISDVVPIKAINAPQVLDGKSINDRLDEIKTSQDRIQALAEEIVNPGQGEEKIAKQKDRDNLVTQTNNQLESLNKGISVQMNLVQTDASGLTITGGILGFAWTKSGVQYTPLLFDSATGKLALYFRGSNDQFFVTYYDTQTEHANFMLLDEGGKDSVQCSALSTESEMDSITITVSDADSTDIDKKKDYCTVTIAGPQFTETWNWVPRNREKFVNVLTGKAGDRTRIGFGSLTSNLQQVSSLNMSDKVNSPLSSGTTLVVGQTKVTVNQPVSEGQTSIPITIQSPTPASNEQLPVFLLEYDYETQAKTTKVPNALYNGSVLIGLGLSTNNGRSIINQQVTSGATSNSQWKADAPGYTLTFDGVSSFAQPADASRPQSFAAPHDLTLEAWVKPKTSLTRNAQGGTIIKQVGDRTSYTLGLQKLLSPALILDGQNDYMSVSLKESLTEVTHELWFKTSSPDCGLFSVVKGSLGSEGNDRHMYLSGGNIKARIYQDKDTKISEIISSSNLKLADDNWHHVAHVFGTIDGQKGQKLYVDGEEVANGTLATSGFNWQDAILIGHSNDATSQHFKGLIDEVRIWNRVRTLDEIKKDINERLNESEANLIGYWYFDEVDITSNKVKDYSQGNNPGTLVGTPQVGDSYLFASAKNRFVSSYQAITSNTWSHLAAVFRQSWALSFDGKGDYLDCGKNATLDICRDLTIEVFLKVGALDKPMLVLGKGNVIDSETYKLSINTDGKLEFAFKYQGKSNEVLQKSNSNYAIEKDKFYSIAVSRKCETQVKKDADGKPDVNGSTKVTAHISFHIRDYGSQQRGLQIDESKTLDLGENTNDETGEITGGQTINGDALSNNDPLTIGSDLLGINSFNGAITEIRLWNVALKQDAITNDIKGGENGLVSWWRFEEKQGNTALDSKSQNHATIKGGSLQWIAEPDDPQSRLKLYYNGELIPDKSAVTDRISSPTITNQFILGALADGIAYKDYFHGEMEELRIWEVVRTQEQIRDNLFRRVMGDREDLIAYYTFDPNSMDKNCIEDHSFRSNHLQAPKSSFVLSTAPISEDTPQVRSALAGIKTDFNDTIQSQPNVQEYGDMQYDSAGNLIGVFKRCYSFIQDGKWNLVTGFKVGDLITEWVGQVQFAPQMIGYIEGAPPVPSENLTSIAGKLSDYARASSIELVQAETTTYNYTASKTGGFDMQVDFKAGAVFGADASVSVGVGVQAVTKILNYEGGIGMQAKFEHSTGWLSEATTGVGRTKTASSKLSLRGSAENLDNIAYPEVGRRFVPANVGLALVKSETADVFALRLKHNNALISFQMRPNPDIPPDWNLITFPINPRYTKQGTLDGMVGLKPDRNYPNVLTYSQNSSYFKPIEAYALKNRIDRESVENKTTYDQFDSVAKGNALPALGLQQPNELQSKTLLTRRSELQDSPGSRLPQFQKRNLVNTYVWTADGGLFSETQDTMDVYQEKLGGTYAFKGLGGVYADYKMKASPIQAGPSISASGLFGGRLNMSVTKSQDSKTAFSLKVDVDKIESDIFLRKDNGDMEMDLSDALNPKPKRQPGRVDAYRFMSFYLEPKPDHFDTFFNLVVDPIWLEQSNDQNAAALRQAQQTPKKPACWRILHRVTYVSRVLPTFDKAAPPSLEKTLQTLDINSNYELIKQLEPFVSNKLGSFKEFNDAIDQAVKTYLPELQSHLDNIKQYMGNYFGVLDESIQTGGTDNPTTTRFLNKPPTVRAGKAQTVGLNDLSVKVDLEGVAIDDRYEEAESLFVTWEKVAGDGDVLFDKPHELETSATFTQRGVYTLRLTANDGYLSASDELTITVNVPPKVSAGSDQNVKPANADALSKKLLTESPSLKWLSPKISSNKNLSAIQLLGSIKDNGLGNSDSVPITVKWEEIVEDGKNKTVQFENSEISTTLATFSQSGIHLLRMTADNGSFYVTDEITIAVGARVTEGLLALYTFKSGQGTQIPDVSGMGRPLDLALDGGNSSSTEWIQDKGLKLLAPSILKPESIEANLEVTKSFTKAIKKSNEITIEAWIEPQQTTPNSLARIVTLSSGLNKRNFTLGQNGSYFHVGIRTTNTNSNASDCALTAGTIEPNKLLHVVCTRNRDGLVRLYIDGKEVDSRTIGGDFSNWDDNLTLALGNEVGVDKDKGDRAWLGTYHLLAIYKRALSPDDIQQNYQFGADQPLPPIVSAGEDKVVNHNASPLEVKKNGVKVTLDGKVTSDRPTTKLNFSWKKVSGPDGISFENPNTPTPTATFKQKGTYTLQLTAFNTDTGLRSSNKVTITVNHQPKVTVESPNNGKIHFKLGDPHNKSEGKLELSGKVTENGFADSQKRTLVTEWSSDTSNSGVATFYNNSKDGNTEVGFSQYGKYVLRLTATTTDPTDNTTLAGSQDVTIYIHDVPDINAIDVYSDPQILSINDQHIVNLTSGSVEVNLSGEIMNGNNGLGDPDGTVTTKWTKLSGPGEVQFSSDNLLQTRAKFTANGKYTLRYTVDNGHLNASKDEIIVVNRPPIVDAGEDQTITLPAMVELDGTVGDDGLPSDPGKVTLQWSGPSGVTFTNPTEDYTHASFSAPGNYPLRLTANDGAASVSDDVTIAVNAPPRLTRDLLALYTFDANNENIIKDVSGILPALNLAFDVGNQAKQSRGILTVNNKTIVRSVSPATKIIHSAKEKQPKNSITIEVWIKPKDIKQQGVIVTLSADSDHRNFTFEQQGDQYIVNLRTSESINGSIFNTLSYRHETKEVKTGAYHLVYTWTAATNIARFYLDGKEVCNNKDIKFIGTAGDFSSWDDSYGLAIANEFDNKHPWLGEVHLVAIYNTDLQPNEISQNFFAGSELINVQLNPHYNEKRTMLLSDVQTPLSYSDIGKDRELTTQVQQILKALEFLNTVDGSFGPITSNALDLFKSRYASGGGQLLGPTTANALIKAVCGHIVPDSDLLAIDIAQTVTKPSESCQLEAYKDPGSIDGLPITAGWGSTKDMNGKDFTLGQSITESDADKLLVRDLEEALKRVKESVPNWSNLTVGRQAALIDFSYNTGYFHGTKDNKDTLNTYLTSQATWEEVPKALRLYIKGADKEPLEGLIIRRQAEINLWNGLIPDFEGYKNPYITS